MYRVLFVGVRMAVNHRAYYTLVLTGLVLVLKGVTSQVVVLDPFWRFYEVYIKNKTIYFREECYPGKWHFKNLWDERSPCSLCCFDSLPACLNLFQDYSSSGIDGHILTLINLVFMCMEFNSEVCVITQQKRLTRRYLPFTMLSISASYRQGK